MFGMYIFYNMGSHGIYSNLAESIADLIGYN